MTGAYAGPQVFHEECYGLVDDCAGLVRHAKGTIAKFREHRDKVDV